MRAMQLYMSDDLRDLLLSNFGEGKISANVERILRAFLENPDAQRKIRAAELEKAARAFNAEFPEWQAVVFVDKKEKAPAPPREKEVIL